MFCFVFFLYFVNGYLMPSAGQVPGVVCYYTVNPSWSWKMAINQWHSYPDGAAEFLQCWAAAAWALAQWEPRGWVKVAQASSSPNVALKPRVVTCLNRQQCSRKTHLSEGRVGMDRLSLAASSAIQSTCPETVLALGKNLRSHGQGE